MQNKKNTAKKDGSIMIDCKTTHARHDPAHCLAIGLFKSIQRGEKGNLDITYKFGKNQSVQFAGAWPLGAEELLLLQGIVALAGPKGLLLEPEPRTKIGEQLLFFLEPKFEALKMDSRVVCDSMSRLLKEIGKTDSGANIKALKGSLKKLANVTVYVQKGSLEMSSHLLSYAFNQDDGALYIALNPRISEAIIGSRPHTRIEMNEVRGLKTPAARLIHQHLSAFINPGKSHKINIDTLCSYVWVRKKIAPKTQSNHRTKIKKTLKELESVGWTITEYKKWNFDFRRPKIKK